jgi:uncharacterized protein with PIN domain
LTTATFRFHGDLDDFLAPDRRGREICSPCAQRATTKHMIEALGVPHTEVARVFVNGEPAGAERLLCDGDQVDVHPDAGAGEPMTGWGAHPPADRPPAFVADAHLGALARRLRMAGFDTLYDNGLPDERIVALARAQARIVLTRDRELLKRRDVVLGRYVRALQPERQLREVFEHFALARWVRPFSRCMACNGALHPVDKALVIDRLPPRVRASFERFSTCADCGRLFWEGSHWRRMRGVLATLPSDPLS